MTEPYFESGTELAWLILVPMTLFGAIMTLFGFLFVVSPPTRWAGVLFLAIGSCDLGFLVRISRRFGRVGVDAEGLMIKQGGSEYKFAWHEVEAIQRTRWGPIAPEMYRISFIGTDLITYFVPSVEWDPPLTLFGGEVDRQSMIDFMQKRVSEAGGAI